MHRTLSCLAHLFESISRYTGKAAAWLTLLAVLLMFANVLMRYFFNAGDPWQVELVLAMHGATFLAAMAYTLLAGEQVRVDVFYTRFSPRRKAWVDLLGSLFLLTPICLALMGFAWSFVANSWSLHEASSEYGGLQGIYLLKTFLIIGPALLLLQGWAVAIRSFETLCDKDADRG